jgi:phosphatidylserine/phosphatidylglycerophosphate/cardiolipin synthase-like enzyme
MYLSDAPGEALEPVIQELKLAAQRGVQIRMAMDAKFFSTYPDTIKALDSIPGIRAKLIDFASFGGIMHAKFFIFDRETIFLGSANTDWRALAHIHEIGMRVRVPMVTEQLQSVFDRDWEAGTLVDPSRPLPLDSVGTAPSNVVADPSITFVASPKSANPPGVGDTLSAWIALADSAKVSLYAQFYEYSLRGWKELDDAFRRAAARGVSVRLMVDATKGNKDVEALGRVKNIQVKLVRVPQFSKGPIDYGRLIHSKYLVADQDAFWVGTENGSKGYFLNTRNVGVVVRNPLLAQQLFTVHQSVWDQKYSVLTP